MEKRKEKIVLAIGSVWGRWTITSESYRRSDVASRQRYLDAQCSCGEVRSVSKLSIHKGTSLSCGCLQREVVASIGLKNRKYPEKPVPQIKMRKVTDKDVYYLYQVRNLLNDTVYVGTTNNPQRRWHGHRTTNSKCIKLRRAMTKYGRENFVMEILCISSQDYILDLEKKVIESWALRDIGYNTDQGGRGIPKGCLPEKPMWDSPIYVSGWWFPDVDKVLSVLNWSKSKFYHRKYKKCLGETEHKLRTNLNVYYGGFWIPSAKKASQIFNKDITSIRRSSKKYLKGLNL